MTKEELKYKSCTRKEIYHTAKKAQQGLAKMKKRLRVYPLNLNFYRCRFCHKYHLGHFKDLENALVS